MINPWRAAAVLAAALVVAGVVLPVLRSRFALRLVVQGLNDRLEGIWDELLATAISVVPVGIGPGALGVVSGITEAHNIFLRAFLDFGLPLAVLFLSLFFTVLKQAYLGMKRETVPEALLFANLAFFALISVLTAGMVQDALTSVTPTHLLAVAIGLFVATNRMPATGRDTDA